MTDREIYGEQLLALLRRLTEADGAVSASERTWMKLIQKEFGQVADGARFDPETLKQIVTEEGDAEELLQLLLMVSLSDGQTTPHEWHLIQEVASLLSVSAQRLETLRSETVLAVDP